MNLVMISPGYPVEMSFFTRGLAQVGATVIGLGDQPPSSLPEPARNALAHYEQVNLADEAAVLAALHGLAGGGCGRGSVLPYRRHRECDDEAECDHGREDEEPLESHAGPHFDARRPIPCPMLARLCEVLAPCEPLRGARWRWA